MLSFFKNKYLFFNVNSQNNITVFTDRFMIAFNYKSHEKAL